MWILFALEIVLLIFVEGGYVCDAVLAIYENQVSVTHYILNTFLAGFWALAYFSNRFIEDIHFLTDKRTEKECENEKTGKH